MVKGKKSYPAEKSEQFRFLIDDIKSRQHLLDRDIAKMMGVPLGTYRNKKSDPGTFQLWQVWNLMQAAGVNGERKQDIL